MIKKEKFSKAYKEVSVIIEHLKEEDKNKIPKEFIEMIESKMDNNHIFSYDVTKDISEQDVLRETLSILAYIYINYIGEYDEVKQIKAQFKKDIIEHEVAKKASYEKNNPNDPIKSFNNNISAKKQNAASADKSVKNNDTTNNFEQEVSLIDSKQDKWYSKIVSFFKNIFK